MQTHTKKLLTFVILCNLVAGALYVVLFLQIRTKNEKSSELRNSIDLGEQKGSRLSSLRKIVNDTQAARASIASYFLHPDDTVVFIEQIEKLGKDTNLAIETSDVSTGAQSANTFPVLQMKVETNGSWQDTVYFLMQLESLPYNIRIKDMAMTESITAAVDKKTPEKRSWRNVVTFEITEQK